MKERDYSPTRVVLSDIFEERVRQEKLRDAGRFSHTCADAGMADATRVSVLGEEFGEVCRALQRGEHDPEQDLRAELVAVAAVACAWIEYLDGQGR
jgi:hypothetical protein